MIEGVTVLQTIATTITLPGFSVSGFILALLAILCLVIAFATDANLGALVGFIICAGVAFILFNTAVEVPGPNQYQVLIDESVSMTEFTERYNIIEQQGITYIIEEKENADS